MDLRGTIQVAVWVLMGLLTLALYALVFAMASGVEEAGLGAGPAALTLRFPNIALVILVALPAFAVASWILGVPKRLASFGQRRRHNRGLEFIDEALLAQAAGDLRAAERAAQRAGQALPDAAAPRVIAAKTAEDLGDARAAERLYAAMLGEARTEIAGRKGLAGAALERGDYETAILHAAHSFQAQPTARWTFDLLFDAQVRAARWEDALSTLKIAQNHKHLPQAAATRRRAVLLTAHAATLETQDPAAARDAAERASGLSPGFAPGAALAARLFTDAGKAWKAADLIERAWEAAPHPALSLAYRDVKPNEGAGARAKRLKGLADLNPDHRESLILRAETALSVGEAAQAEAALGPLARDPNPSARLCGLLAQIAAARRETAQARAWLDRAGAAPGEPDWSDLDPEGPAFAYTHEDWARMVYTYGDTGQLIHPRHERFERAVVVAPALPEPEPRPAPDPEANALAAAPIEAGPLTTQPGKAEHGPRNGVEPVGDPDVSPETARDDAPEGDKDKA